MTRVKAVHLGWLLAFSLLLRLISLATYPLMDTTEARYGEMARLMVETGNWLTPQFDYGIPFWGKPPLFAWVSAASIKLFGLSEFAVRAPHWLAGALTIFLAGFMACRAGFSALIASLVLATCGIFSIASGAIMTDMVLTLAITLSMMGFYYCWCGKGKNSATWGYLGFIGLAFGMLAKGPVAIAIVAIAVFPWLIYQHGFLAAFKVLWQRFPILGGCLLMLAVALPWYLMAEFATPGFIRYFIIGEHFERFVVSGWDGDLYGKGRDQPRGMIWLFWLLAALPWSIVLPAIIWQRRPLLRNFDKDQKSLFGFLICWLMAPMILFTLAGNILPAYILPGVPALAILFAMLVTDQDYGWLAGISAIIPMVLLIAMPVLNMGIADKKSDRVIFERIDSSIPTFYIGKRPFSAQFYSDGKAKKLENSDALNDIKVLNLIGKQEALDEFLIESKLSCFREFKAPSKRVLYSCVSQ